MNEYRTEQINNYFLYHPDAVTLTIPATGETVSGLFDDAFRGENPDKGNVKQQKKEKHFSCSLDYESLFTARTTVVSVEGASYKVYSKERHFSQGVVELWLV